MVDTRQVRRLIAAGMSGDEALTALETCLDEIDRLVEFEHMVVGALKRTTEDSIKATFRARFQG